MRNQQNYIGCVYNDLTILDTFIEKGHRMFICKCICGNTITTRADSVKSNIKKSCGCKSTNHKPYRFKSLDRNDYYKLYNAWKRMFYRCYNPKHHKYSSYGARGITMCDEWKNNTDTFIQWSMRNGYNKDLSIDRIDNNGNYEPSNCRWTTKKQQQRNRRNTFFIEYNGDTKPLSELCELFSMPYSATKSRIDNGWSFQKCIDTPIRHHKNTISTQIS